MTYRVQILTWKTDILIVARVVYLSLLSQKPGYQIKPRPEMLEVSLVVAGRTQFRVYEELVSVLERLALTSCVKLYTAWSLIFKGEVRGKVSLRKNRKTKSRRMRSAEDEVRMA